MKPEPASHRAAVGREPVSLTRREIQVAKLATNGFHDREIADSLHVAERTVKGHLHHIYRKLGLRGRNDLTRHCIASGWT